jgi:signal peptidase II
VAVASDVHSERETIGSATAETGLNGQVVDEASASEASDDDAVTSEPAGDDSGESTADSAAEAQPAPGGTRRPLLVLIVVAALALLIDAVSKALVVSHLSDREPVRLLGGALKLTLIRNSGAAFSIGEGQTWVFTIIATAVVVVILRISRHLRSLAWACALGLLLGGALGNLSDRIFRSPGLFRGHVVDFVQFGRFPVVDYDFPVFNLADSAIVVGGCLMVLLSFLGRQPDGTRHRAVGDQADDHDAEQPGDRAES